MYTQKDLNTIKDIILRDVPGVTDIILFGSYANGTADEKNDMGIILKVFSLNKKNTTRQINN